jgi:hypothetical protein
MDQHAEVAKHSIDAIAALGAIGTIAGWMPNAAAFLAVVWYGIRMYEWWRGRK